MKRLLAAIVVLCAASLAITEAHAGANVLMHHNDNNRSGANLSESQLTPANVNSTQFGKLWDYEVDSEIYAQPLIIQNVTIPGLGTHDVVIVATMNNTVYAFDADNNLGANVAPLWQTNFNDPAAGIVPPRTADLYGSVTNVDQLTPVGIMSTPAIDLPTNTLYVLTSTKQNGKFAQQLRVLDLTTGAERASSPATIAATSSGTGYDAVGGVVTFNPQQQVQRTALAVANGQVVIAWASHADIDPYHGWVMAYDKTTLKQTGVFNTSPNGSQAGIWQSGDGPAIDGSGFAYFTTGNGSFDGASSFGESVVKLGVQNGISVQSFFAPSNYLALTASDLDLGASGPLLIPNTSLLLNGSKTGDVYLLNTGNLGGEVAGNTQIPETFSAAVGHIHGAPVYYPYSAMGPLIYLWSERDTLKAYHFNGSTLDKSPVSQSSFSAPPGMPGGFLSVSANGTQPGTGIIWASIPLNADAEGAVVPGVLRAFDASDLSTELWDSQLNPTRDSVGLFAKYTPPTVANGKVYMASFSNKLRVYGLLGSQTLAPKGNLRSSKSTATGGVNLAATGTSDWTHWPGYIHAAAGGSQISDIEAIYPPYANQTYTSDPRTFSWTGGTPTATGGATTGVSVSGWAGGFRISAPADTNSRTLTIYVGGANSSGHLRAYLSDGSAEDITDTTATSSGSYYLTYTLTYAAAQSGQLLSVEWTQASSAGSVLIAAAALSGGPAASNPPPSPAGASATQGTSSSGVAVSWGAVSGATSYTVYRSTASGTQGVVLTTLSGISYTDTSAAGGITYYYSIVATNTYGASIASAQVSGYVPASVPTGGALNGAGLGNLTNANLTSTGTSDWAHWPEFTEKATGGSQISNYSKVGSGSANTYANAPFTLSWSDGKPTATGSATTGAFVAGIGNGFQITVPADTNARQLTLYVGGWSSKGKLTAHLSDGSAADFTDSAYSATSATYQANYTLTYHAASAGQTLTVTWTMLSGNGNVVLDGAALAGGAGGVGELAGTGLGNLTTANLTTTGTSDWAHWPEFNEKTSGKSQISNYTVVGAGTVNTYSNAPLSLAWSDGNQTLSGSATTGAYIVGTGRGFQITVPADTNSRQLTVYAGGWQSAGKLVGHLSDGSAVDFTDNSYSSATGTYQANYTLTYHAASAGQTLTVTWTMLSGSGNVVLDGAALAGGGAARGALTGSGMGNLTAASLTTVGTSDWAHWPEFNEKLTGASQISNYVLVGAGAAGYTYGNAPLTLSWSDGNRTAAGSATTGSYVAGIGKGFQITVPANTTARQFTLYVGGWNSAGKLTAHLSDGSAADFNDATYSSTAGTYQANYTLSYQAASAGQTLTVTWTMLSGSGNVVLDAAALH